MTGTGTDPDPRWVPRLNQLADDSSRARSWWTWGAAAVVAVAIAGAVFDKVGALVVLGVITAVGTVRLGEQLYGGKAATARSLLGIAAGFVVAVGLLTLAEGFPDGPEPGADLRGEQIEELSEKDLRGARLSGATLEGLTLTGRDFSGAIAQGTSFRGSKLSDAVFRGADLRGADFTRACLRGTDFSGADLDGVTLTGADVRDAVFPDDPASAEPSVHPSAAAVPSPRSAAPTTSAPAPATPASPRPTRVPASTPSGAAPGSPAPSPGDVCS